MHIERNIIIGLIVSTDYVKRIRRTWDKSFLQDPSAQKLSEWCLDFYDEYDKAPGREIQNIFYERSKQLPKEISEEIESEILPGLSEEFEADEKLNLDYLLDRTFQYFTERHLTIHNEKIQSLIDKGKHTEAQQLASNYKPLITELDLGLDLSNTEILVHVEQAFNTTRQPVVRYPKQLGDFWNEHLVRGSFIALMGPEKRGKTFWLIDMALRACSQRQNVAFFEAGDMTEAQLLKRICIYLAQKSDLNKYCGKMFEPVRDCVKNQLNTCDKKERECDFGLYKKGDTTPSPMQLRKEIEYDELLDLYESVGDEYRPCYNCDEYQHNKWGAVWLQPVQIDNPLTLPEAKTEIEKFFIKTKRKFKLSVHPNNTLTVSEIKAKLEFWEKNDNFIPDMIVVDYADLLVPEIKGEYRHQQNDIWKNLRSLSQAHSVLLVTATQADASSYDAEILKAKHFSEDKRKLAHVTAMFGLNQDPRGREKKLGVMRINEIVVREGESPVGNQVYVLQNLRRGRPFYSSFW